MESQQQINRSQTEPASLTSGEETPNALPARPIEVELVHLFDKIKAVRAFVFDVDGVLTNNDLLVTETGDLLRTMNIRDGQAIKWAIKAGFQVGIITGGKSPGVKKRLTDLGIEEYYSGALEKWEPFQSFLRRTNTLVSEVCYMGDDLPDLPVLRKVVLSCCPADATREVLEISDYVSTAQGGRGCVRDIIEKVLKLQDKWPEY